LSADDLLHGLLATPRANLDLIIAHRFTLFGRQEGQVKLLIAMLAIAAALAFVFQAARSATTFEYFNQQTTWKRLPLKSLDALDWELREVYKRGGSLWLNRGRFGVLTRAGWRSMLKAKR
jgi:hypothetical protein